jgi:prepilin-type N-terminal cleavage/methylation domain-containing protein
MKEKGFTLIELLVVIAIIGILAAIAIPQFAEYRKRAFDSRAQSDLRNVMTAQEAYYVDNLAYTSTAADLPGFGAVSDGVTLSLAASGGVSWSGTSYHPSGNKTFCYNSAADTSMNDFDGADGNCS